jgi:hypothetical protein
VQLQRLKRTQEATMVAQHSGIFRGLDTPVTTPTIHGARFGRMFPDLPAATYSKNAAEEDHHLDALANAMVSGFDGPKDGPDGEESGIPALYTYFGQFVDHDLTFDPSTSFQKQKDPTASIDFRTPAFDLDNLYGRGPGDQPFMYASDSKSLLLGDPLTMGNPGARDLQRTVAGVALIGDPRNDENAIVSQLQGLMIRFHNGMVADNPKLPFDKIQELVRHHYQYVVVNDFLSRIVNKSALDELKTNGVYDVGKLKFFTAAMLKAPFMPLEFSVAAYRLGHSMIRPGYRLNDTVLLPIFPLPASGAPGFPEGLTGFRRMITDWAIDWGRFIDIDERDYGKDPDDLKDLPEKERAAPLVANFQRLQFAYRIDTALVDPLRNLPPSVVPNPPPSLAFRNLKRARQLGLPSGQAVAKAMGVRVLDDKEILIGQDIDGAKDRKSIVTAVDKAAGEVFAGNCPLWTYILAEAAHNHAKHDLTIPVKQKMNISTPQLGPVGGRIVAEVFLGLLFADPGSYLSKDAGWTPRHGASYRLKDLVKAALAH